MYVADILKTNFIHEKRTERPDFIAFFYSSCPKTPIFTAMKHIGTLLILILIACTAPSCSKKSGCPAESAQTKVDKHGNYKTSKSTSGLLPKGKHYKKEKGAYKPKHKEKHTN
jgi:hypothetical protein